MIGGLLLKRMNERIHAVLHVAGSSAAYELRIFDPAVESRGAASRKQNRVVAAASQDLGPGLDMSIPERRLHELGHRLISRRCGSERVVEHKRALGQLLKRRRSLAAVTVHAQMVRSNRVDEHIQNVEP